MVTVTITITITITMISIPTWHNVLLLPRLHNLTLLHLLQSKTTCFCIPGNHHLGKGVVISILDKFAMRNAAAKKARKIIWVKMWSKDIYQLDSTEASDTESGDNPEIWKLQRLELFVDAEKLESVKIAKKNRNSLNPLLFHDPNITSCCMTHIIFLAGKSMYLFLISSRLAISWVNVSLSITKHFTSPSGSPVSAMMFAVLT